MNPTRSTRNSMALAIVAALLGAGSGCAVIEDALRDADKPSARIVGVDLQDFDLESVTLAFDVEVANPYSVALPLVGLDYALASQGTQFISGSADQVSTSIPPKGEEILPVTARVPFTQLLHVLSGVTPGAVVPYQADLAVKVDAPAIGEVSLPLSTEGEVPIPAIPRVALTDIKWESLSFTEASAVATLEIGNVNQFPIDLQKLAYDLALANTSVARSAIDQAVSFDPGGAETLGLRFSLRPLDLGMAAFNLLKGAEADYGLRGTMDVETPFGPLQMPISATGKTPMHR